RLQHHRVDEREQAMLTTQCHDRCVKERSLDVTVMHDSKVASELFQNIVEYGIEHRGMLDLGVRDAMKGDGLFRQGDGRFDDPVMACGWSYPVQVEGHHPNADNRVLP